MSTALQTVPQKAIEQWKSPLQIKDRIEAIQRLMKEVLKPGTAKNEFSGDYGIVPGTKKPSLWKSGSEQILAMFQIAVEPVVEDLSSSDCYRFRVTTRLTNVLTGEFLGAGIGECSTDETKYKWRRTYSRPEFDATDPERRRIKYGQYKGNNGWEDTQEMQVRQEPADLANTILKMAKKRSQIDATLTVTGASSMFEQDFDELPEETRREMINQRGGKKKQDVTGDVMCAHCRAINGHLPSCITRKENTAPAQTVTTALSASQPSSTPTQTVEAPEKPAWTQAVVKVTKITEKSKEKDGKKQPYLVLDVTTNDGDWLLYVWDKKLFERAVTLGSKFVIVEYSQKTSGNRTYCSLEAIGEVQGEAPPEEKEEF